MSLFENYVGTKKAEFGTKFDGSDLCPKFIPYFNNQKRIKIKFSYGEVKSGTVGITTGWKPCFLLMLTKRSRGSAYTLSEGDEIIF